MSMYKLIVPKQAVGASLVYFDMFNAANSPYKVEVLSVLPIVSGAVAVPGTLAVDLFLTRTTAVGTGGTAAVAESTSLTAASFAHLNGTQPMDVTYLTARLTPSGGATAGAVLAFCSIFTEETNAGTYAPSEDMVRQGCIVVNPGSGIRVVQGSVASVGNIAFSVVFRRTQNH